MAKSLSGMAPPRRLIATGKGIIEERPYDGGRRDSTREMALILLKLEAMTEAALQGYGALISHMITDGETVQCVFEHGMITKSISTCA
jgi:hypothetical protein